MSIEDVTDRQVQAGVADLDSNRPGLAEALKEVGTDLRRWPLTAWLIALAITALYIPILCEIIPFCLQNETYSFCVLIPLISLVLLFLQRERLRRASYAPDARGLYIIALGVLIEMIGWFLRIKFLMMASLVPVLAGSILALHGRSLWRACRFPVLFLLFAAPVPVALINPPDLMVQHLSSVGAASSMSFVGFPVMREGNVIQVPGMALNVAEACSGFKKLLALFTFAVLYGWLFALPPKRWALLVLAGMPIALLANIVRVAGLIAVATFFAKGFTIAHEYADYFVIGLSCILFVRIGRMLGCDKTRFAQE